MAGQHVEKMPAEVVERLLTAPFGKKYVYFREYTGRRPKRDWNRKPIVGRPERPFAELQYVQRLEAEGWTAGWCYRPGKFISTWEPTKQEVKFPDKAIALLEAVSARASAKAGCWDVFAWKKGRPLFVELKRRGSSDRLRDAQKRWRDAAVELGVSPKSFREVQWMGGSLDGYSVKAMSCVQGRVDGWIRYGGGRFEFGGENPQEMEKWLQYRQRVTGLKGADLLWVLFREDSYGPYTYWDFEQSRDRKG